MRPDSSHPGATYRPEIDGLRALAVVPVMLFHAGFERFQGGYLGVDVFFVISGYLITTIILGDLAAGRFTICSFYERRARRILPALLFVIAVCIPFAVGYMLPMELRSFARSVLAALVFIPNIFFWQTTSYFHASAEELPLLHTWSLGVEEQFYLAFPLVVAFCWRFGLRVVVGAALVIGLASFGLTEWAWRAGKTSSSFFLPFTRAWELMIGALLAMALRTRPLHLAVGPRLSGWLSSLGLFMLAGSIATFDSSIPMPSAWGLIPTVGTALAIGFAVKGTLAHRLLSQRWLVSIGLVSYSAYLWHQPLLAFARVHLGGPLPFAIALMLIALTFLLAMLTWKYVESPFRQRNVVSTMAVIRYALAGVTVLAGAGLAVELTRGLAFRFDPETRQLEAMADPNVQGDYVTKAFLANDRDFSQVKVPRILVIGDSYAQDFVNLTFESGLGGTYEVRTRYLSRDCQILFGQSIDLSQIAPRSRPDCDAQREVATGRDRLDRADLIVLAGSWRPWAAEHVGATMRALDLSPSQAVVVVGVKNFGVVRLRQLRSVPTAERQHLRRTPSARVQAMNAQLSAKAGRDHFVDLSGTVCLEQAGCPIFTPQGQLISFDGTHLTQAGAKYLGAIAWSRPPLSTWAIRHGLRPPPELAAPQ